MRKYKNDIFLILGLLFITCLGLILYFSFRTTDNLSVHIYYDKELIQVEDISIDKEIIVNNVVIIIENKEVYVKHSDCKDQICVNQGKIKASGQTITCLPQRVYIQIVGNGVDVGV